MHWSSYIYLPWNVSSFFYVVMFVLCRPKEWKSKLSMSSCQTTNFSLCHGWSIRSSLMSSALSNSFTDAGSKRTWFFLIFFLNVFLQFICMCEVTVMSSLPSDTVSCWSQVMKKPFLLGIRRFSHLPPPMLRRSWDLPTCTNGYSNLFVTSSCRTAHSHQHRYTYVQHYSCKFQNMDSVKLIQHISFNKQ